MRLSVVAIAGSLACVASIPCAAEEVFDAGFGVSSPLFTGNHQFGLGVKGMAGWHPDTVPILIDAGYLTTGEMRDTSAGPKSIFTGGTVTLGYRQALDRRDKTRLQFRLGYYDGRSEVSAGHTQPPGNTSARGVTSSLGVEYRFLPYLGLRVGLDALFNVPDFSGPGRELIGDGRSDFFMLSVGITLGTGDPGLAAQHEKSLEARRARREAEFEQRQADAERQREIAAAREMAEARERELAAARALEEMRAREQAQPPAAAAPAEPAPAAPAAPAATSAVLAAGQQARLRPGAILRARATPEGAAVPGVVGGDIVSLKATVKNQDGAWWYVNSAAATGWVREVDLEAIPPSP